MKTFPGTLEEHIIHYEKFPEEEYDPLGIPYGIQIDYDRPFLDSLGNERNVVVYRPSTLAPLLLAKSMIVLCDETNVSDIADVMNDSGLVYLAEHDKAFLVFVLPTEMGWNSNDDPKKPNDTELIFHIMQALREGFLFPGREQCISYYMGMIGAGAGAEIAQIASAQHPEFTSCLLTFDGNVSRDLQLNGSQDARKFVWLVNTQGMAEEYWIKADGLESTAPFSFGDTLIWRDPENPAKQVRVTKNDTQGIDAGIINRFWNYVFTQIVRTPGIGHGEVIDCSHILKEYHPCLHKTDRSLGDNQGISHNWIEFIPESVRKQRFNNGYSCPLIIVMHGGGCTPDSEIAVFNTHELGEEEGFVTVYPNASAKNSWNSTLLNERYSDVDFIVALIEFMKHHYPIDPTRVYLSGFSNGSGMAHVIAAVRPDLIAGIIAFNTRYPIKDNIYENAKKAKQGFDYRMPVFSTYGTLDFEYPMQPGCGQFTQMNFWKWFNNIPLQELDPDDPSGVGAPGQEIEKWGPVGQTGKQIFTTHKYFCNDANRVNYYNYTLIEGLPHAVEKGVMKRAWEYVSRFSRMEDGSLQIKS